ncbi:peptidoglycan-binding domain-containing protein [Citreicella sp. C3M06]|uniref:peptidoglycan recognition protein family protein n=1 Tax=Citreicella sp. C3M06 TaxID=2841564 RepID=UPI001C083828|nr:peptidoglycan-binding domain-containing protein [Citreicella sp. C3M06]MBU2960479.1 peptidoglycan-binding domain-containing protein [Citreicella sp. C3M06]
MNRIILHHTGGSYAVSNLDREHYHRIIDGSGEVHDGVHAIAGNAPGRTLTTGTYAAHTRALNTGSIGVSICAMASAEWGAVGRWAYPVRPEQVKALVAETARLCGLYGIAVSRKTVLSHAEVEPTLGVWQRGKWDFDYTLFGGTASRDPVAVGDEFRAAVLARMVDLPAAQDHPSRPTIWQGAAGHYVRDAQDALGITVDGAFGPITRAAVVAFQAQHELLPDGVIGPMTWAALL